MEDIEIQIWEEKEKKGRWRELLEPWYNFWTNEPVNSSMGIADGKEKSTLTDVLEDMLNRDDTPCVIAWDKVKQQVAGCVMSFIEYKCPPTPPVPFIDFEKHPFEEKTRHTLQSLGTFLDHIFAKADIFTKYKVNKAWLIDITSVTPEYARRGIANQMTARVLELAKEEGFEIAASKSTSAYTQRSKTKNYQFEKVLEMDFENNCFNYSDMSDHIKDSHKSVAILVKRLK